MTEDAFNEDEDETEINAEDDEEIEEIEYVYGLAMPPLPDGMQPLECVVLITGIMMETGTSTITAMGSDGMTPWMAVGMMAVESHRLTMGYTMNAVTSDWDFEENDEDEDGDL